MTMPTWRQATIGDSGTPVENDRDDFVGGQYPRLTDGTIVVLTLDFDGAARHGCPECDAGADVRRRIKFFLYY